jgi:hypothetical protein
LPDELRDRVYRPPQSREPLVDLLTSFGEEQRVQEKAPEELPAEPLEAPARPEGSLPERPGWSQRLRSWFFDFFAVLNRTYEVRVATMIAFAAGAAFFACLCFLLGTARTRPALPVYPSVEDSRELAIIPPSSGGKERAEVQNVVRQPASPKKQEDAGKQQTRSTTSKEKNGGAPPKKFTGPVRAIQVTAVGSQEEAQKVCDFMRRNGLEGDDPRCYQQSGNGLWIVIVGRWASHGEASQKLHELEPLFERMIAAKVIHNRGQFPIKTEK